MKISCARLYAAELVGIDARIVEVEVDIRVGLHSFVIVGLADKALNEARERVNAALGHIGVKPPHRENRKITVNLAPADARKTGTCYDLAIALGYLRASGQMSTFDDRGVVFVGELALDGRVRPVRGCLSIADRALREGFKTVVVPHENAREASAVSKIRLVPVAHICDALAFIQRGEIKTFDERPQTTQTGKEEDPDLGDIHGQDHAKRALAITAAGGHNLLLRGPPGVGKSMLARALPGILPPLSPEERIEVTRIYSAAGLTLGGEQLVSKRPVRSPHQTVSLSALIGGGAEPIPGEVSLAHRGVLFLDELPEFPRHVLDALRQPLESREVTIVRARQRATFPANCMLVAAMNPCPCGFYGDERVPCTCTAGQVLQYAKRVSGPLLDRIDIVVRMGRIEAGELNDFGGGVEGRESGGVRSAVAHARRIQWERFVSSAKKGKVATTNSDMSPRQLRQYARLNAGAQKFLKQADLRHVSPRGYYRLIKVSRTIADLENAREVGEEHLAEAYTYRFGERTT